MELLGRIGWLCDLAGFANNTHNEKKHTVAFIQSSRSVPFAFGDMWLRTRDHGIIYLRHFQS